MKNENSKPTYLNGVVKPDDHVEEIPKENIFKKDHPIFYRLLGLVAFIIGYVGFGILIDLIK